MALDQSRFLRPRVAIVGGGISGMSAAWALAGFADISVFEAGREFGGHARTIVAGRRGNVPVDTGFIVFNYANYPHLTRLFRDLDVPVEKSDMSFGMTADGGRIEFGLATVGALFAQRRNMANPRFLQMIADILKFNARAEELADSDDMTIEELVSKLGLGKWFREHYLLPMCGAIWSTPSTRVGAFPARTMVRFFKNHALMSTSGQHQWWTVSGGSTVYVQRLVSALREKRVQLFANAPVEAVRREAAQIHLRVAGQALETFDHVIFATHADRTLKMLVDPSHAEEQALSSVTFQDNHTYLHADPSQMPKRQKCWSSWVYQSRSGKDGDVAGVGVTYWMNRLQNIDPSDPLFVTLNPATSITDDMIYDQITFRHPVFDRRALSAQSEITSLQGRQNTWFAGAWMRHGFHEDGIASGYRVARQIVRLNDANLRAVA